MQTKAERIALIKATAKAFYAKKQAEARFVREEAYKAEGDEMHWADASKYAKQYYGDVYSQTTKHDRDEDSYDNYVTDGDEIQEIDMMMRY